MEYFVIENTSLKRFNTLQLEARASLVILPFTAAGLGQALRTYKDRKIEIIGNGSNIVFSKSEYDEHYVFIITTILDHIEHHDHIVTVEAGVSLNRLAWFTCENSIDGFAFSEDIPGTIGGALFMNAGQWEYSIGQYVKWIEVYNRDTDQIETIYPDRDFFAYRFSMLSVMNVVVLRCGLQAEAGDYLTILDQMLKYRRERYVKQPRNYPNAGSVFKRPVDKDGHDLFVWKLFDEVKLRGFRIGDAMISDKHPGFIVNLGDATVQDIAMLIQEAKKRVKDRYEVDLELEWRVI